jgi:hypothetical protein
MATKNQLLDQARRLGLSGLSRMTKAQLQHVLTDNPCHHLDVDTCRTMSREELRGIARKCKVIMGRNTQDQICQDIYDKFHGQAQPNLGDPVINDPCHQLDIETCRAMPREELRRNARQCKVIMGRKSQDQICQDIYEKFHGHQPGLANDPCYQLDVETCRTMPREELRRNARTCKVIMGRKSQDQICQDIYDKFHEEEETRPQSPPPRRRRSPPPRRRRSPPPKVPTPPRRRRSPPPKAPTPPRRRRSPPPKAPTPPRRRSPPKSAIALRRHSPLTALTSSRQQSSPKPLASSRQRPIRPPFPSRGVTSQRHSPPTAPTPARQPSSPRVNIPSRKLSPSKAPLPQQNIVTETIVNTQKEKDIDAIVKAQAAQTFTAHLTTNFTKVAAYNANPKHQFEYQSCDIKVDKMTEHMKHSQSVAKIYTAMSMLSNANLIIKMWINYDSWEVSCLNAEWTIYRYIIPFLFYKLITPCVLIPFQTGKCTANDFTKKIRPLIQKLDPKEKSPLLSDVRYIATPNIPMSLHDFLNNDNSEIRHGLKSDMMYALMFQLVYTVTAFATLGLRHNDCHMANIRVLCDPNPNRTNFKLGFELEDGKTRMYSNLPVHLVFFDFDRMGIDKRWPKKYHNVCTYASTDEKFKTFCHIGQCSDSIGGRRDLLILAIQLYNYMPRDFKKYLLDKILAGTPERLERFNDYIRLNYDNTIQFDQMGYENFIFRTLPDEEVVKLYPKSSTILHDPKFLTLCTTKGVYMQKLEHVKYGFTMYSYKNKLSQFKEFTKQFHNVS